MKRPPVEKFDSKRKPTRKIKPEEIDMSGLPEIQDHPERAKELDASTLARKQASSHAITKDDGKEQENRYQQAAIRKAKNLINQFGHQTVYLRVTEEEKLELRDLTHEWRKNTKTKIGETLLGRIALTMMIEDHKENDKKSFLSQVLKQTEE